MKTNVILKLSEVMYVTLLFIVDHCLSGALLDNSGDTGWIPADCLLQKGSWNIFVPFCLKVSWLVLK